MRKLLDDVFSTFFLITCGILMVAGGILIVGLMAMGL